MAPVDSAPVARLVDSPAPLRKLRRGLRVVLYAGLVGGASGLLFASLKPPTFRSVTTLLVAEPRGVGSQGSVDYLLTPIRSYTALVTSPALCEACASVYGSKARKPLPTASLAERLSVRIPENTRLLQLSFVSAEPEAGAAFLSCVAEKAVAENRRINAELASKAVENAVRAREVAHVESARLVEASAAQRSASLRELRRTELEAALADVLASAEEERRARVRLSEAAARRSSYETTRPLADKDVAEERAHEAAAAAAIQEAARSRQKATERSATLEQRIAESEAAGEDLRHRLESARAAEGELEKRQAAASLESASRAFELVTVSPASAPVRPVTPGRFASAAAGAFAAAVLGALVVLSRSEA